MPGRGQGKPIAQEKGSFENTLVGEILTEGYVELVLPAL